MDRSIRSARLGEGPRVYHRGGVVTGSQLQHGAYERGTGTGAPYPYAPARSGRACGGVAAGRPRIWKLACGLFCSVAGPCSAGTDLLHVLPPFCVRFAPGRVRTGDGAGPAVWSPSREWDAGMPPLPGEKIGI